MSSIPQTKPNRKVYAGAMLAILEHVQADQRERLRALLAAVDHFRTTGDIGPLKETTADWPAGVDWLTR